MGSSISKVIQTVSKIVSVATTVVETAAKVVEVLAPLAAMAEIDEGNGVITVPNPVLATLIEARYYIDQMQGPISSSAKYINKMKGTFEAHELLVPLGWFSVYMTLLSTYLGYINSYLRSIDYGTIKSLDPKFKSTMTELLSIYASFVKYTKTTNNYAFILPAVTSLIKVNGGQFAWEPETASPNVLPDQSYVDNWKEFDLSNFVSGLNSDISAMLNPKATGLITKGILFNKFFLPVKDQTASANLLIVTEDYVYTGDANTIMYKPTSYKATWNKPDYTSCKYMAGKIATTLEFDPDKVGNMKLRSVVGSMGTDTDLVFIQDLAPPSSK